VRRSNRTFPVGARLLTLLRKHTMPYATFLSLAALIIAIEFYLTSNALSYYSLLVALCTPTPYENRKLTVQITKAKKVKYECKRAHVMFCRLICPAYHSVRSL